MLTSAPPSPSPGLGVARTVPCPAARPRAAPAGTDTPLLEDTRPSRRLDSRLAPFSPLTGREPDPTLLAAYPEL